MIDLDALEAAARAAPLDWSELREYPITLKQAVAALEDMFSDREWPISAAQAASYANFVRRGLEDALPVLELANPAAILALAGRLREAEARAEQATRTRVDDLGRVAELRTALQEIEAHHVEQNRRKGREESRSTTLRLARAALGGEATDGR